MGINFDVKESLVLVNQIIMLKLGEIFQILILGAEVKSEVRLDRNKLINH